MSASFRHVYEFNGFRLDPAERCFRRALEIDPTHTASYLAIGKALLDRGDRAGALRWLRHGAKAAARPDEVASVLHGAEAGGPAGEMRPPGGHR